MSSPSRAHTTGKRLVRSSTETSLGSVVASWCWMTSTAAGSDAGSSYRSCDSAVGPPADAPIAIMSRLPFPLPATHAPAATIIPPRRRLGVHPDEGRGGRARSPAHRALAHAQLGTGADRRPHGGEDRRDDLHRDRLDDVVIDAGRHGTLDVLRAPPSGDRDDERLP